MASGNFVLMLMLPSVPGPGLDNQVSFAGAAPGVANPCTCAN